MTIALLAAAAVLLPATEAAAQSGGRLECGSIYTVVRGDTLHDIAIRAYGRPDYPAIFKANREVLRSVTFIEVGDRILIPCLDGSGFQTYRQAATALEAPGAAALPGTQSAVVAPQTSAATAGHLARIAVLDQTPPYAGSRLPEGGMVTELVSRAMSRAATAFDYEVVFPEGASVVPAALAESGFDLGFPAVRPDCARPAGLDAAAAALCDGFLFSEPVAETERRVYVAEGGPLAAARRVEDLAGARVCTTAAARPLPGEAGGIPDPSAAVSEAQNALDCFRMLAAGEADVAVVSGAGADRATSRRAFKGGVSEILPLRRSRSLHVVATRDNRHGRAFLATLDAGLAEIRRSGEWQAVVENHRAYQAELF